ncbi:lysoplasmalogenase family protein [Dermacoccaceae bacterium W4C1]
MSVGAVGYAALSAVTSVATAAGQRGVHAVTKVALMPWVQIAVGEAAPRGRARLLRATSAAAWLGDVILLGEESDPGHQRLRLRCGAAAFALQQVGYLWLLNQRHARPPLVGALAIVAALGGAAALDSSGEEPLDPYLTGYGVLLGAMGACALGDLDPRVRLGGGLFVASDVTILIRDTVLTGRTRDRADGLVMATYAAAQWFLVSGFASDATQIPADGHR